ncbi:hypothetical protein [Phenylobacterium sp.]|uniref:hypothetical protein n=1 Tax=Phenylobacterium sp. TaxID=1871053 RepID=UPI00120EAAFB|nr:hypothetical protein [Phenylobacterium sp.]THD63892.1 MAG: hypothetical protein E8A49_04240 [Phenylobacterium sp.]
MNRILFTTAAVVTLGLLLSACGGGGDGPNTTVTTPPPAVRFDAQFGANFSTDFQQPSLTSKPLPVAAGDVVPVSLTAQPVPLPST